MSHEGTSIPNGLPGASGENYEPIPRGTSNQSILSNQNGEARESSASTGRSRPVVIVVAAVVVCLALAGGGYVAWPYLQGGAEQKQVQHGEGRHKHLRVAVQASTTELAPHHAAVAKNTSTRTTTATTTSTATRTTTATLTTTVGDPKLFCFTIMRSSDAEVALMREQLARGAGIYGCDEWAVYSDKQIWLSPGPPTKLESTLIAADLNKTGDGISTKYKNSKQFLRAWEKIREDGQYKGQDWIVKADPDTVFFPQRLKHHLVTTAQDPSKAKFFANCRTEDHPHFMFGALEVFSVTAAEEFFKHGARCEKELKSDEMWEERYISHCLHLLKVDMDADFDLLRDKHCDLHGAGDPLMPCVDDDAVAFHPLRSPSEYFTCRGQAQQHWEDSQKEKEDKEKREDEDKKEHKDEEGKKHGKEKKEEVEHDAGDEEEVKKHEKEAGKKHTAEKEDEEVQTKRTEDPHETEATHREKASEEKGGKDDEEKKHEDKQEKASHRKHEVEAGQDKQEESHEKHKAEASSTSSGKKDEEGGEDDHDTVAKK